jgi:hypothetical protein
VLLVQLDRSHGKGIDRSLSAPLVQLDVGWQPFYRRLYLQNEMQNAPYGSLFVNVGERCFDSLELIN